MILIFAEKGDISVLKTRSWLEHFNAEFVFLDDNGPGAHYWLDTFVGFDVSKVIVELVKEKKIVDEYEN
jgi:hypothetical protein